MHREAIRDTCGREGVRLCEWAATQSRRGDTSSLRNIRFNLPFPEKKGLTQLSCTPGFTLQLPMGQSCWLTSMREALSVTLQAFHYGKALASALSQGGRWMQLPGGWRHKKKKNGRRALGKTDYVKVTEWTWTRSSLFLLYHSEL